MGTIGVQLDTKTSRKEQKMEPIGKILVKIMEKEFQMTRIECAWCGETTGFKPMETPKGLEGKPTSTICEECLRKHFPQNAEEILKKRDN